MASYPLGSATLVLLLDDGWPSCTNISGRNGQGFCKTPAPRGADGRIVPDPKKFPNGMLEWTNYAHARGLKVGIYTAPHKTTCGGYTASLNNEAIDAQTFADWGIDFVKLDAGCQNDCSIHDGCIKASLTRMRDGLNATGRRMVFYVDDGNPTSGPIVYNPFGRGVSNNSFTQSHIARQWNEEVVSWGPNMANMWKLWFDRWDGWSSILDNAHQQVGMQWFQSCGAFNNMDMMTVGQGALTQGQYRAEMFLYAVLGTPLILSADVSAFQKGSWENALVTNPEIIAVNQDPDCVQGTKISGLSSTQETSGSQNWAGDMWVKPLSDGSFAAVIINKDPTAAHQYDILFGGDGNGTGENLFPAGPFATAIVRDLYRRQDMGVFTFRFNVTVPPLDAVLVRIIPQA